MDADFEGAEYAGFAAVPFVVEAMVVGATPDRAGGIFLALVAVAEAATPEDGAAPCLDNLEVEPL